MKKHTSDWPIFYVTADVVALTIRDGVFSVLLIERGSKTQTGRWALPGGFVHPEEDVPEAAYRELAEECSVTRDDVVLEQLRTYGAPDRDPRGRVVTVAHVALGADLPEPTHGSDASDARWWPVEEALGLDLAFDHSLILRDAVERARAKLEYTTLATAFCRREFTLSDLRGVYETVWGERLDQSNFQRKVLGTEGFVRDTGRYAEGRLGRPPRLYIAGPATELSPPLMRG
ncbi:NUDIX hydrolase [Ornithinimicrobium panacihumi]|uniref:NUDIX hydrolase n=1 Tax=Ornithinimicrobium panacihumi TaxID=2008449 RepID=UPI003F88F859